MNAEIELLALQKGEADNLSVRLPPADAFRKANIDYSGALLSVKFSIEQRGEQRYVVVISSAQAMNEPFLDLLVELDWATGRLVREYTFLLDPPEYKGPQAAPATAAPATSSPVIKPVEMPKQPQSGAGVAAERPVAAPATGAAAPGAVTPKAATAGKGYEVKRGDTLTRIASANRPENVTLQQMLMALYRSNADAFDGNNINRMRAGKILNIPDAETVTTIDRDEAARTVLAQGSEFNEYRRNLGAAVAAAPERADRGRQSASGKITARVEDKPAAVKDAKDQVKLSKAEEPGKPGAGRSPQGLQEDLLAKEKALKEANDRITMLEKNVQDMRKLLELKSQSGAQLQQQAAKAGTAKGVEPAKAPEPVQAIEPAKVPEPAKATDAAKAPEPAKAAEPAKAEDAAKAAPKAAAPKAPPKVAPPPPESNLIDEILGNELALYGGGAFLLLLFAAYGYYAWRRKKALQTMESSALGAPSLGTDSVFGTAGGAQVDTGSSDNQGDFSPSGSAVAIDAGEVDPIAEADVYMAYGRDTQAEEILKEALAKDPSRQPIRTKLLEIYANRKDSKAFEAVAAELHAAANGEGAEWAKAAALGSQLDPGNPLYRGETATGETRTPASSQVFSGAEIAAAVASAPDIPQETPAEQAVSPGLDFDLGLGAPPAPAPDSDARPAPATDITADLGFDLDLGGDEIKPEAAPGEQRSGAPAGGAPNLGGKGAGAPADAVSSIDFDFELPGSGATAPPAPPQQAPADPASAAAEGGAGIDFDFNLDSPAPAEEAPSAPLDLSSISLDLGSPGEPAAPPDAHWQEVATKLDLAKAYQEMGDKEGTRELLNEVLKEGDMTQQQQAQTMLQALG